MFENREIEAVYAQLSTECSESSPRDAAEPEGKAPPITDVVTLHFPLRRGTPFYEEVGKDLCPGLDAVEKHLDGEDDQKKTGSYSQEVSRKGWGTQNLEIFSLPLEERTVSAPTLKMASCHLKGKPTVHQYPGKVPCLRIQLRGTLETGPNGETSDLKKRVLLRSRVWVNIFPVQEELPLSSEETGYMDRSPVEEPLKATETKAESWSHVIRSKKAEEVVESMNAVHADFLRQTVTCCRERTGRKDGPAPIGWADIEEAATLLNLDEKLKEVRRLVG